MIDICSIVLNDMNGSCYNLTIFVPETNEMPFKLHFIENNNLSSSLGNSVKSVRIVKEIKLNLISNEYFYHHIEKLFNDNNNVKNESVDTNTDADTDIDIDIPINNVTMLHDNFMNLHCKIESLTGFFTSDLPSKIKSKRNRKDK